MDQTKKQQLLAEADWIGLPESELERCHILEGDLTGRFAYFTHTFTLTDWEPDCEILISANARYRLWINGAPIHSGPAKGNLYRYYYDTIPVSDHLVKGENLLAVQVLYQDVDAAVTPLEERSGIYGVINPGGGHRLLMAGKAGDHDLTTGKADWKCYLNGSYYVTVSNPEAYFLGAIQENVDASKQPKEWKRDSRVSASWPKAAKKEAAMAAFTQKAVGFMERFLLEDRDIPLMYEREDGFARELTDTGIFENGSLCVPAESQMMVILDAGCIKNTYPVFEVSGGAGADVEITYYEKHQRPGTDDTVRDDITAPVYYGVVDHVHSDGETFVFEPFWYRTFRFLRFVIRTASQPLTLQLPKIKRTGYPLSVETELHSSEAWVEQVYGMCVRTLQNCMMETYMDSPHYEQLQYPMDTRLQILFNYSVSKDFGLVRKAIRDFHDAILPWGILPGKAPTAYLQIITTFSLHYIFILWEYYEQTKDLALLKKYRSDLDRILDYYDAKIDPAYGMVGWLGYWPFVDWQGQWNQQAGVPVTEKEGPSTVINLMYGYALLTAAKIAEVTGREGVAEEYRKRQQQILWAVEDTCWVQEKGLYKDGPAVDRYSLHAQSWAVLNGCRKEEEATRLMKIAAEEVKKGELVPISFSTSYEFFRACEMAGCYELTRPYLQQWIDLIPLGCMTCPETPYDSRSDCHAWSALPMYELVREIAGIRPAEPGWEKVRICPHMGDLHDLSGGTVTPKGEIVFDYQEEDGQWKYRITLPEGLSGEFVYPDGKITELSGGREYCL